jgi:hypothetical protein
MRLLVRRPRTRQRLSSGSHKLGLQRNLQPSPGKSLPRKRKAFSMAPTMTAHNEGDFRPWFPGLSIVGLISESLISSDANCNGIGGSAFWEPIGPRQRTRRQAAKK